MTVNTQGCPSMVASPQIMDSETPLRARSSSTSSCVARKAERVAGGEGGVAFDEAAFVGRDGDPVLGVQPEVCAAMAADPEGGLKFGAIEHLAALGALGPEAFRHAFLAPPFAGRHGLPHRNRGIRILHRLRLFASQKVSRRVRRNRHQRRARTGNSL